MKTRCERAIRLCRSCAVLIALGVLCAAATARAQVGPRALPTLLTTPRLVSPEKTSGGVAASAGYGIREQLVDGSGHQHTALGGLGVAVAAPWGLAGELRVDGRLEKHDTRGDRDPELVGAVRGFLRYAPRLSSRLALGIELGAWVPGGRAPSLRFDAVALDALLALDARVAGPLSLVLAGGFRFDRSGRAMPDPDDLSTGDWISLGLSDSHAALARCGLELALGRTRTFAEWTWDALLGGQAPALLETPMHVALGTRVALDARSRVQLTLAARALVSRRAPVDVAGPLSPFPPRAELWTGLSFALGGAADEPPAPVASEPEARTPASAIVQVRPAATTGGLRIRVLTQDGAPIPGAQLALGGVQAASDDAGWVSFSELSPGEIELSVAADGFESRTLVARVAAGESSELEVHLTALRPSGQLRLLVRDHGTGEPLMAKVLVHSEAQPGQPPSEHVAKRDGRLELELAPGRYVVEVKLYGWRKQKKTVEIEDQSVTMIDVALHARSKSRQRE